MIDRLTDILTYDPLCPMMFNSGLFWVLFLLFIPLYGMIRERKPMMMLYVVAFSLYFYYKSSGWFCLMLVARAAMDYYLSAAMLLVQGRCLKRALLAVSLATSLAVWIWFKYAGFFGSSLVGLVEGNFQPLDVALPVGLSFYTLQSVSYMVDVYRGCSDKANSFLSYLFYLSFFPSLVAGPIVRASSFLPQLSAGRRITERMVFIGFWLVLSGVVKKAVIADCMTSYTDLVFASSGYSGFEYAMGLLGYSMQIYFDFSGYSDMAVGLAGIMGFDLGINFRSPYKALNITDFWRRWHISLSAWLRDYVYIPLGGNRKGWVRTALNLMTVMLIGGLWHGAGWHYLVWGGLHGLGLVLHKAAAPFLKSRRRTVWGMFFSWLATFLFVTVLWAFFRAESVGGACSILRTLVFGFDVDMLVPFVRTRSVWFGMLVFALVSVLLPRRFYLRLQHAFLVSNWFVKLLFFMIVVQCVLEFSGLDAVSFIYSRF